MTNILVFVTLCTATYYLLARAEITRWFWQPLDGVFIIGPMLRCPACTGWWLGLALAHLWHPLPHACGFPACLWYELECGLLGMVGTAIGWGAMKWGLDMGAVSDEG